MTIWAAVVATSVAAQAAAKVPGPIGHDTAHQEELRIVAAMPLGIDRLHT